MATKYTYRCPNQSYAISLEMCLARQLRDGRRCRQCKNRPATGEQADVSAGPPALGARVAA